VKHFWDDENLRIVEAGSRAAQEFLREQEEALPLAPERAAPTPPGAERLRAAYKPLRQ
jgi:hypothetical protein